MTASLPVSGNTKHTRPENRAFYPALDGLRAIAFLMVFLNHYRSLPWGWAGVDLFFVLSGFLITGILYDSRDDAHRARNFYVRRTLRIFPLYYGVLLLIALSWPLAHWQWNWRWLVWPLYLGNFASMHPYDTGSAAQRLADFQLIGHFHGRSTTLYLGHFWSLCVEEQFYLLWPWLVFSIRDRRKLQGVCLFTIVACLITRWLGQHTMTPWMLRQGVLVHLTPFRLDDLLTGGLLGLLLRGPHKATFLLVARRAVLPSLLLAISLVFLVFARRIAVADYPYPSWFSTLGLTLIAFLAALLFGAALQPGTWFYRTLTWYPLRWAGRLSYGAYVFHDITHDLYFTLGTRLHLTREIGTPLMALGLTYVAAWLSFRFFEGPLLDMKERWTIRSGTSAQAGLLNTSGSSHRMSTPSR